MLQLIVLLLCVIAAIISTVPLQIAWMSDSDLRKQGIIAGLIILAGGLLCAIAGAYLSFATISRVTDPQ